MPKEFQGAPLVNAIARRGGTEGQPLLPVNQQAGKTGNRPWNLAAGVACSILNTPAE